MPGTRYLNAEEHPPVSLQRGESGKTKNEKICVKIYLPQVVSDKSV